jgi:hypothetical protein
MLSVNVKCSELLLVHMRHLEAVHQVSAEICWSSLCFLCLNLPNNGPQALCEQVLPEHTCTYFHCSLMFALRRNCVDVLEDRHSDAENWMDFKRTQQRTASINNLICALYWCCATDYE